MGFITKDGNAYESVLDLHNLCSTCKTARSIFVGALGPTQGHEKFTCLFYRLLQYIT